MITDDDLDYLAAMNPANPDHCPAHLRESLDLYATQGVPVGSFLQAVLANDLMEAVGRADHINMRLIPAIASYVYSRLPRGSHGSREIYAAWVASHAKRAERQARDASNA